VPKIALINLFTLELLKYHPPSTTIDNYANVFLFCCKQRMGLLNNKRIVLKMKATT
jgi:hypothetical protein